jgi:glycosyltransferase involved in cell wall biosynthesis
MKSLHFFFRHSDAEYFSIEKLFMEIGGKIKNSYPQEFNVRMVELPHTSKIRALLSNIFFARKNQADINHITGDVHYGLLGFSRKNLNILTVHDCVILHRYPAGTLKHKILKWLWYDLPVKKADAITVISANTKEELIHFTGCSREKITVIGNFVDPHMRCSGFEFNEKCPRLLFIGTTPNKNLEKFIDAIEGIPCQLEIVGSLNEIQLNKLKAKQINYLHCQNISHDELALKYKTCDILTFPSTYEGFGLPILEGQVVGRPVLTSNHSPMKEVAGRGACLIDPFDIHSIKNGLLKIIYDVEYRNKLIIDGIENVRQYSLDNIAAQYAELYRRLLKSEVQN